MKTRLITGKKIADTSSKDNQEKRITYLADATGRPYGLDHFSEYLTLLFEVDALFVTMTAT